MAAALVAMLAEMQMAGPLAKVDAALVIKLK
jgi:hypothetical protein